MKKIVPTLIALGVFIVVLIFYQNLKSGKGAEANNSISIWKEDESNITSIDISTKNETISIKRNGSSWDILSPIEYPADSFKISELLHRFSSPNANGLVEESPKDLSVYGLDSPIRTITINSVEGTSIGTLALGNTAPLSKGYYVLDKKENKVYTMDASIWDEISLDTTSLRDKTLLSFDEEYVEKIIINNGNVSFTIDSKNEEAETKWYSGDKLLDGGKVKFFLSSLSGKNINEFVNDNSDEKALKEYGLKNPKSTITLYLDDKENSSITLYIGNIEENTAYVTVDKKYVYKVDSTSLSSAELNINYFLQTETK